MPFGKLTVCYAMAMEIVDLPWKNGDCQFVMLVYRRVYIYILYYIIYIYRYGYRYRYWFYTCMIYIYVYIYIFACAIHL